jgi:hypothetical protein
MSVERSRFARPKARDDALVVERVDDELLVYDLGRDKAHCLNETAALVFEHCDGERGVAELAERVSAGSGVAVDEQVVWRALVRLSDEHLLAEPLSPPSGIQLSRRQVLARIGVAGAAAGLALPAVKSIVAPTAAQAGVTIPACACGGDCSGGCICPPACSCCCSTFNVEAGAQEFVCVTVGECEADSDSECIEQD